MRRCVNVVVRLLFLQVQLAARVPGSLSRHGVIEIPLVEGMAAQDAPHGEVAALERAIFFDGLQGILGARGIKPAARPVPKMLPVKPFQLQVLQALK